MRKQQLAIQACQVFNLTKLVKYSKYPTRQVFNLTKYSKLAKLAR